MKFNKEENRKIFKKLPNNLQEAIMSVDNANALAKIGEKHKLHIDKRAIMGELVGLVMLGRIKPSEFNHKIKKELEISDEEANEITKDVDEKIFAPIKDALMKAHSESEDKEGSSLPDEKTSSEETLLTNGPRIPPNRSRESLLKEIENPSPSEMTFKKESGVERKENEEVTKINKEPEEDIPPKPEEEIDGGNKINIKKEAGSQSEDRKEEAKREQEESGLNKLHPSLDQKEAPSDKVDSSDEVYEDIFEKKLKEDNDSKKSVQENTQSNYGDKDPYREPIE